MTEPTDAEILELASQYWHCLDETESATEIELVRAALAKWGTLRAEKIVIPTDTMEQEFQKHYRLGYEAGKKATTPQPTQAQAGAVPLTDEKIFDCVNAVLPGKGHRVISETDPEYANEVGIEPGARWIVSEVHPEHSIAFARAIEAEVRKRDEALIRQLVGALEDFDDAGPIGEGWKSDRLLSLLASARARLEGKP